MKFGRFAKPSQKDCPPSLDFNNFAAERLARFTYLGRTRELGSPQEIRWRIEKQGQSLL